ncbi:hypothetical protein CR162_13295 [Pseudoroseomonas rhizosphaerae]|uniref:Uncharacterized protein n=1 Tax=Teichococcus rhizosphaerae TaxID=1335062 RepID=A0A2C6Z7H7_9PROT|nr:hypothetical protein [Pseudoroseomonas rhizosphaerae]PHK94461.1 hypothetical protein CR162_13295 [Pseudoroseomonas rhizosphaerae]
MTSHSLASFAEGNASGAADQSASVEASASASGDGGSFAFSSATVSIEGGSDRGDFYQHAEAEASAGGAGEGMPPDVPGYTPPLEEEPGFGWHLPGLDLGFL